MRFFVPLVFACAAIMTVACVHEEGRPSAIVSNERRAPVLPPPPSQYVFGDRAGGQSLLVLPLHGGAEGVVVENRRVIVARGESRLAADLAPEALHGVMKLPSRFGGGFLFWTDYAVYRAEVFDSALIPVTRTTDRIDSISLGPRSLLVRTSSGARWAFAMPKGERVPIAPLGVVDVVALDDGRALGFDDRGAVFTSQDGGEHWNDVTAQVRGRPSRVLIHEEELWLEDDQPSAMRLEPGGHLSWFDQVPEDASVELRPRDPRWRGSDYPLRAAIRSGVAIDESTALVVDAGDLYRIDTRTGAVVSVIPGKLPPEALCQGMAVSGDVLFACSSRMSQGTAFVVSRALTSEPVIEHTFGQARLQFFASADGGLAYTGPCSSAPPVGVPPIASACVRMPGGTWEERDLSLMTGIAPSDVNVARWIPRADGHVVAIVTEPQAGIYDPITGVLTPVGDELKPLLGYSSATFGRYRIPHSKLLNGSVVLDSSWSFSGSSIRGVSSSGETFEILEDGKLKPSPFAFESTLFSFNLGVSRSKDGRLFQSIDHGVTWNETAAPPTGMEPLGLLACSSVGCDFGAFYRLGWQLRPPHAAPPQRKAPLAPAVPRRRGVELSCHASGAVTQKILPRTESSPDDLGLGAVRLPVTNEKNDWLYVRLPVARGILSSWLSDGGTGDVEMAPALRLLLSGFSATTDDRDTLVVNGPTKNILSLRRGVAYVAPFDPSGRIVRTGINLSDAVAAARRAGMTADEFLSGDPTENGAPFPITPLDPNAVGDVAMVDPTGLVSLFRGDRVRLTVRPQNPNGSGAISISAVSLPGDETAILEAEPNSAAAHVYKIGPGGVVDLFDLGGGSDVHPANPDALAVGPKNELAIIRTPSGGEPPSDFDPAYVVLQNGPPVPLAAWSTMKLADDPACKSEPGGYRATIQAIGPWIRVTNPDLKIEEGPMIARVRWTPRRVCVEAFEVKMPRAKFTVAMSGSNLPVTAGTWLVAKGSTFARVSTAEGIEWRQPIECSTVSTGP